MQTIIIYITDAVAVMVFLAMAVKDKKFLVFIFLLVIQHINICYFDKLTSTHYVSFGFSSFIILYPPDS